MMRTILKWLWKLTELKNLSFSGLASCAPVGSPRASRLLVHAAMLAFFAAGVTTGATTGGLAADITERTPQWPGDCVYQISGRIEFGDFEKVRQLDLSRERFNGESTSNLVICLDSPGGDFLEGILIAQHFHLNGAGTLLEPDARCFSICAIIFMMGIANGGEVSYVNRSMHFTSTLGFHRPYITFDQAKNYSSDDVNLAFDYALESIFQLSILANEIEPWGKQTFIRSDLMKIILGTPGDQLFYIDTVDKAGRWNIRVNGIENVIVPGRTSAYHACENALQWNTGTHPNSANLYLNHKAMHAIPDTLDPDTRRHDDPGATGFYDTAFPAPEPDGSYRVTSFKSGYASADCHLKFEEKGVWICGKDGAFDVRIGDGVCASDDLRQSGKWIETSLLMFPPDMSLSDFGLKGFSNVYDSAAMKRCTSLSPSGDILKREHCVSRVKLHWSPDGKLMSRDFSYLWPDGSDTYLEITYARPGNHLDERYPGRVFRINNQIARFHAKANDACFDDPPGNGFFCVAQP